MSDLGDIGDFLDENKKPLSNLDWLDVDPKEYRRMEKLPEQNFDTVPELEAQWRDLGEDDNFRLSPVNRAPEQPITPFIMERRSSVEDVCDFAYRRLHAGDSAERVVQALKRNFDADSLQASQAGLKSVLAERGLVGNVYIDSALFSDCHKGNPKGITANAQKAPILKGKKACGDCIHNSNGRCGVFHKEISMEVEYSKDLMASFSERLTSEGKTLVASGSNKSRLQAAILSKGAAKHVPMDGKPVVSKESGISYKDAVANLKSKQVVPVTVRTSSDARVCKLACAMMQGNHSAKMRDILASSPEFASLRKDLHLLGNLYSDLSYFPTYKEAGAFLKGQKNTTPFIVGIPYNEKTLDKRYASKGSFEFTGDVTAEIARRYVLAKYASLEGRDNLVQKVASALAQASEGKIRRIAQSIYKTPLTGAAREYVSTQARQNRISLGEAQERLRSAAAPAQEVVTNPVEVSNRNTVVAQMLRANHDAKITTLVTEDPRLASLKDHLNLLGKVYVDTTLATPAMVKQASKKNPTIAELPVMTPNNREGFFLKSEVKGLVAKRIASLKGVPSTASNYTPFLRDLIAGMDKLNDLGMKNLARKAFSRAVQSEVHVYANHSMDTVPDSGLDAMSEFELGYVASNPMGSFDLHSSAPEDLDVSYGDGMVLE